MTNKCRRRINRGKEYITTEISQKNGGEKKEKKSPERKERGS